MKKLVSIVFILLSNIYLFAQWESLKEYQHFDFIPGEEKIETYRYLNLADSSHPEYFISNTDIVTKILPSCKNIHWIELMTGSTNAIPIQGIAMTDYTTVDFDLLPWFVKDSNAKLQEVQLSFHSVSPEESFADEVPGNGGFYIRLNPQGISASNWKNGDYISNDYFNAFNLDSLRFQKWHISMIFYKNDVDLYINSKKVAKLAKIVPEGIPPLDRFSIFLGGNNPYLNILFSNFSVTKQKPDYRKQLASKGKFSNDDVFFAPDQKTIEPRSYPILQDLSNVISENTASPITVTYVLYSNENELDKNKILCQNRLEELHKVWVEVFALNDDKINFVAKTEIKDMKELPDGHSFYNDSEIIISFK
jgi:hypothetical protein